MRMLLNVVQGQGLPLTLEVDAPDEASARQQAVALGYSVLSCRSSAGWLHGGRLLSRRGAGLDVAILVEQLRDLLSAGLSVIEAIQALRRGSRPPATATIERLEQRLRQGQTLSQAMAADAVFPALLVALVRASELTSDLPQTLTRYLEHQQRVNEVRHRLTSTAIYPMLLIGVGGLVMAFLLFYVMPRFARVFEGMSGDLPWSARAMVTWSHWIHGHGGSVLWALAIAALLCVPILFTPAARNRLMASLLDWRPLRDRLTVYFLSRWYRTTGMLVDGGIPLPQALRLANGLLPSALQSRGREAEREIHNGLSPSAAYSRAGMATPVAEQLLLAGERTGDLGTVLGRIALFHELEVSRALERSMRSLEPLVMVFIGVGVGLVVVLMYLPIFELASAIQ